MNPTLTRYHQPENPDHDQESHGNWADGKNGRLVFKATPAKIIDDIAKNGLKRGGEWNDNKPSVYFTESETDANKYGFFFGDPTGGGRTRYAIIEFAIPESVFKVDAIPDDFDKKGEFKNSWRIEKDIPADWIRGIKIYDMDEYGKTKLVEERRLSRHAKQKIMFALAFVS